jgi:hypothetical protein
VNTNTFCDLERALDIRICDLIGPLSNFWDDRIYMKRQRKTTKCQYCINRDFKVDIHWAWIEIKENIKISDWTKWNWENTDSKLTKYRNPWHQYTDKDVCSRRSGGTRAEFNPASKGLSFYKQISLTLKKTYIPNLLIYLRQRTSILLSHIPYKVSFLLYIFFMRICGIGATLIYLKRIRVNN